MESSQVSQLASTSSTVTGLAIFPIRVKAKERLEVAEIYAFFDSVSNTSFCTESLLEKLDSAGRKTTLSLTTLKGENIPSECFLVSLGVSDLNQENVVELPVVRVLNLKLKSCVFHARANFK